MQEENKHPYGNIEGILTLKDDPLVKSYRAGTLPLVDKDKPKKAKKKGSR